ncbi:hypothetical protein ASPZODRAFT_140536 [Penicilliopsis zonata CBS 506.65]|uniref:Alpha-ketoglutarate-dependent dioxygenase AlkB-like domain-containing protein n=1 Tax=Penicilliopsis zonata CBS 506.65 TaxID=1073090 RepID=A0A1L9SLQ6_9EURO|nr:hypothetical protein ASPZODRAFT_140536 [Penicilliopsis zonata CBS 506.65]OJJ48222.1 hypothetical protein ASPZODRAFT_140536 [Penicilliopsis zonata CBS 506.65]
MAPLKRRAKDQAGREAKRAQAVGRETPRTESPVHGEPPAWAESRPDLCDALPWFRAVQGGSYHKDGFCWGYLIDADSGIRSYIDDEIVITRVGGGCTKDADGNLVLVKDQDSDGCIISSLMNSQAMKVPVGLVIGDRNTLLGRTLPHRYNVMGYFRITDIWYEKIGGRTGAKVRFEKLDLAEKSWWAGKDSPAPPSLAERDFAVRPETETCAVCVRESMKMYLDGWMCLNPSCARFWTLADENRPTADDLAFHPAFLRARHIPDAHMQPHESLVPDLLETLGEGSAAADCSTARIAWKGIVCPQCRKCISRRFWRGWKCTDEIMAPDTAAVAVTSARPACSFEKMVDMQPISLRAVVDEFELSPIKRALYFDTKYAVPLVDDHSVAPYRKLTYLLPGVGSITHFVANRAINRRTNGPDDLFRQLQLLDLGLRRYPLQQSVVPGTLTAHFAVNYQGMPYKYVVSVDSKGFDEASDEILRALGRLSWATEQAVQPDEVLPPNELLVLGYFNEMKIGYHDDGESALGPTIATLSLGARSTMSIRMKYKYYHGYSRAKKLLTDDPVLAGCRGEESRRTLRAQMAAGQLEPGQYDEQRRQLLLQTKASTGCRRAVSRTSEAPVCVRLAVHHGDLVVMHGEKLQQYYEHAVVPEGRLRFALTARHIQPAQVAAGERVRGETILQGEQVYDGR